MKVTTRARRILGATLAAACTVIGVSAVPHATAAEAQLDRVVSANPENWTPNVNDGRVNAIVQVGTKIIAVGKFTSVTKSGVTYPRTNIFAFDATTGAVDQTFLPNVGTSEVFDVADAGNGNVYIGGAFASVNGVSKTRRIAMINTTTGAPVTTFKSPIPNQAVSDIQLVGGRLYIGGSFTAVNGIPRTLLAALNPATGADTGFVNLTFTDTWNGGSLAVKHFDVSDDAAHLVAIGNWRNVNGQSRPQIMMADLTGASASLSPWSTQRFTTQCAGVFDTYTRDVDIAPDGSYFVTAATGAWTGGVYSGTLCDSVTRFEVDTTPNADPTWIDYTGGDTLTQVKVVGDIIYVGGHNRWLNNPFAGDWAGPGAVSRAGLAAVDPRNGLPTSWNPTRARGVGVWEFMTTTAGLWVGHDTNLTGGEQRKRIALFPAAGGTLLPPENTGSLPGDVVLLGKQPDPSAHWVTRVNAAGSSVLTLDAGPHWTVDTDSQPSPLRTSGGSGAGWGNLPVTRGPALPTSAPTALFSTERYGAQQWDIPAPVGHHLTVRLYFANMCSCTAQPGQRVFDVSIDGSQVLDNYDIVSDVGNQVGTMKEFSVTSDGNVDVDLSAVVENPLINGIEVIDNDVPEPAPDNGDSVEKVGFDGDTVSSSGVVPNGGQVWSMSRGAFMVDGVLYTGWADGTLKARTFNGSTFGAAQNVNLNGLTEFAADLPHVTGMFYDRELGRLYYTMSGSATLWYRYFLPESRIVGAVRFAAGDGNGQVDFSETSTLFLDGSTLYVGNQSSAELSAIGWSAGALNGPAQVVSGPAENMYWNARGSVILAP